MLEMHGYWEINKGDAYASKALTESGSHLCRVCLFVD